MDPIEVAVSQGENQRSMLRDIDVTFPIDVQIEVGAFSLVNREDDSIVPDVSFEEQGLDLTVATLTFSGPGVEPSGSLADGNYVLTINGDLISNAQGIPFDVDGDGTPGGVLVFGEQAEDKLYRFFGDAGNGDRFVDNVLILGFSSPHSFPLMVHPATMTVFDFRWRRRVDNVDLGAIIANLFPDITVSVVA